MLKCCAIVFVLLLKGLAYTGNVQAEESLSDPRQLPISSDLRLEYLTWVEVRDLIQGGTKSIIVPTGGVEQNGPFVALGKHNFIIQQTSQAIASRLGKTLIAPIIQYVPEGEVTPPEGHMRYPGTLSLREETFEQLLEDTCRSLRAHGFEEIILIGDSGGNQLGLYRVALKLDREWRDEKTRVLYIPEYYDYVQVDKDIRARGIEEQVGEIHDSLPFTLQLLALDPSLVRYDERVAKNLAALNGIALTPLPFFQALGQDIVMQRTERTVAAISAARKRARPTFFEALLHQ